MISEEEARAKILESIQALPARDLSLANALNHFAAEDVTARHPLPVFDNSAMDGYAIIAGSGQRFHVVGEQPAGLDRQLRVAAGEAVRIFTGAPIPIGADTVVMQEDVTREGDDIVVNAKIDIGDFIRRRGCDLSVGQKILRRGERLNPTTVALLAGQGFTDARVGGEASAAVLSTGDELTKPGEPLEPGQIYESNSVLLAALLKGAGATVNSIEHCCDDLDRLVDAIKRGAQQRLLIISGGVSVGAHDFVQRALQSLGARIDLWRVAIKPGKPFLYARIPRTQNGRPFSSPSGRGGREAPGEGSPVHREESIVFGLPGNPVSSFVTFLRFVRPALWKLMGASQLDAPKITARLMADLSNNDAKRPHYVRGRFENGTFAPVGRQESHALFGLSQSNALLPIPAGAEIKRGAEVEIEVWD